MRWERAEEPVTWTTIDNVAIDADLSDRALGMLVRWLRRPPGAELDSIPERVKRAKRDGRKHLEGRDAQYAASYELEKAGFLVREPDRNELGQHEWVVRIYSRPVPPDKRSNPEDRKRSTRKASATKPQVSPVTGNPEPGNQEPENQESGNQGFSSKNSHNDSLSGDGSRTGAPASRDGEREAAAPEDGTRSAPESGDQAAATVPPQRDAEDQEHAETFARSLPGNLGRTSVARLVPGIIEAVAEGWTSDALRTFLVRKVDVGRVAEGAVPSLYLRWLADRPAPPASAQQPGTATPKCVKHSERGAVHGDLCVECHGDKLAAAADPSFDAEERAAGEAFAAQMRARFGAARVDA